MGSGSHLLPETSTMTMITRRVRVPYHKKNAKGSIFRRLIWLAFVCTGIVWVAIALKISNSETADLFIFESPSNAVASELVALSEGHLIDLGVGVEQAGQLATGTSSTPVYEYSEATKQTLQLFESEDAGRRKREMIARREARSRRVRPPPETQEVVVQYGFDFLDTTTSKGEESTSKNFIIIHDLISDHQDSDEDVEKHAADERKDGDEEVDTADENEDEAESKEKDEDRDDKDTDKEMPKRCGRELQSLFSEKSSDFPTSDSITKDSVVLITGILSQLGFHIALKLASACDVKIVMGVESFEMESYATDQIWREHTLEQITLLYSQLAASSFRAPLILSPMGAVPNAKTHRYYKDFVNSFTGELEFSSEVTPTHIVHIGSVRDEFSFHADSDSDSATEEDSEESNPNSHSNLAHGSGDDNLYWLRHSLITTEQILSSLERVSSPVHFTFVSDINVLTLEEDSLHPDSSSFEKNKYFYLSTKLIEELMVHSYAERLEQHHFVTLRLPQLFGPWGKPGAFDYDIAQNAIMHWHDKDTMSKYSDSKNSMLLNLSSLSHKSQSEIDLLFVDDAVHSVMAAMQYYNENESNTASFNISGDRVSFADFAGMIEGHMPMFDDKKVAPQNATRLQQGVTQLLAWHLNKSSLPGSPHKQPAEATKSGMEFLMKENGLLCDTDDMFCLRGHPVYPCASECSDAAFCTSSPFDKVIEISQLATKACETVLYTTMILNKNEENALPEVPDKFYSNICSIAFVDGSKEIEAHGHKKFKSGKDGVKLTRHKGWTVIPIDIGSTDTLPIKFASLLKISPGNFFHSHVERAVYLAENFTRNPSEKDIMFTASLLHSPVDTDKFPMRGLFYNYFQYEVGQTKRQALIVFPAMRAERLTPDLLSGSDSNTHEKITAESGLKQIIQMYHDTRGLVKNLNLYYQNGRVPRLIYNDCELNSDCEYKFSLDHWTRDDWLTHNLSNTGSKHLRCDWYREHTRWEFRNEILSFAQVMARLKAERFNRIDDEEEKVRMMQEQKERRIDGSTSDHEWHVIYDQEYVRILDIRSMVVERKYWEKVLIKNSDISIDRNNK